MNNELFDRMIKDNLQEMRVAPSAGVKKVLGWKLFFQNMLVFHKIKLAVGLLLVSGASTYYFVTADDTVGGLLDNETLSEYVEQANPTKKEQKVVIKENISSNIDAELNVNEKNDVTSSKAIENKPANSNQNFIANMSSEESNDTQSNSDISNKEVSYNPAVSNQKTKDKQVLKENKLASESKNNSADHNEKEVNLAVVSENDLIHSSTFKLTPEMIQTFDKGVSRTPILESEANLVSPNQNCDPIPFLSNDKGMFGELSFDLYKGVMGQSEVASDLKDAIHRQYYWDFHGEDEVLNMNVLGGANVSYSFGARMLRLKATAGISYYSINDTKAVYEFEEITDPAWLNFFNTDELAWVDTYGKDTCTQCFYAHSTEELKEELEQDYNKYSYLRVPLQLGTQLNFKYVCLDLLGGLDLNLLTKSRGLYVKSGLQENYERFYYWDDMQLSTLSKGNEMLKKSFMSWSLAANLRVRVSKNFDLLAGYQINKSMGNITNDDYMMKKSLKSSNVTLGITFYPSRASLKPKF